MGASGSKKHSRPPRGLQERLLRARAGACGGYWNESGGEYSRFQEGSDREQKSPSCEGRQYQQGDFMNTPWKDPAAEREKNLYRQQNMDDVDSDDDDQVRVSVTPKVPLRPMTHRLAIDMSHLIKTRGGLEGMFYSERRHKILNIYLEKEEGIIADWQNYTHGPGVRYPMFFGWLWKLVPVDVPQEGEDTETHCLVHPAQTSKFDDPHGETLVWEFDPLLAYSYEAFIRYPEEFGHKSGLPEEEWKARLKARGIPFS
ncbi:nef protein [Human immunodeficiency virus 2]|uniref:Protein Nef n=1 Tax=Human immunodeficiency virus type 2 subtype A (isolate ROD) TaxID=11720 RepID=NEF_HV2RO|nr:RecName: Full=Protein Nef; AltName: Full=3'ORF; AltName: Full=Negative factor; Short=F-protein [Human immunodeficiency virus type 2 (ISOLATE ROD)]AAB00771.1 nef protein [Human immunodeficiency virus 2]CAA28915.1 f protein [Human immunodeficiency virus 2]prf//1306388J gene F [Human immunodeficiency virus 2]